MQIEFWFEFASTYSYLSTARIEALAAERGLAVAWKPFLLGPIFAAQGWGDSPFNLFPAKGRYMWRDLERRCLDRGLPFARPTRFPRSGLLAARVMLAALARDGIAATAGTEAVPWLPEFVRRVFRANFAEDREISEPAVIAEILDGLGEPAAALLERATTDEVKHRLRERTEQAQRLGLFGAPSFLVAGELFWGDDRLEDALAWARRHG